LIPVFIYLFILSCLFHRECFFSETGIGTFDDEYRAFILPRLDFIQNNYFHGISSLWNPFVLTGTPFMSHPESQFFYPPRVISYLLFSPEISDRVFVLFHLLVAALGIFLYVKTLTKNFSGALLAASLCIVCGPTTVMVASGNEITLPMLAWWPFILWATEEFARTERRKYLCVIIFSLWLSILAQQLQIFAFMAIFYLFYLMIVVYQIHPGKRIIVLRELFISSLAALLLSGIQIIPTLELASLSNRLRSYSVANSDPLKPYSFLSFIFPPIINLGRENWQGFVLYFGFLPLLLAFWSVKTGKRMLLYGIYAIILVLMALGLPIYWVFYKFFPFGKYMNGGEELTFALAMVIPIMAGAGWALWARPIKSVWLKRILFMIIIAECIWWGESYYKNVRRVPDNQIYSEEEKQIADIIKKKDPLGRFIKFGDADHVFIDNLSMSYRIHGIGGFYNFTYKKYSDLLQAVEKSMVGEPGVYGESPDVRAIQDEDNLSLPLFDLMNVKYILSLDDLEGDQYRLIYDEMVKVYENRKCLPRVFLVGQYEVIEDGREIINKLTSPQFQPDKILYLTKQPTWRQDEEGGVASMNDRASIVKYEPDKIIVSTEAPRNSLLFISDMFYPGWHALIDNEEVEIYEANYAFRAVPVPAGRHAITFYYFPLTLKLGFILSVAGFILAVFQLRRRKVYN